MELWKVEDSLPAPKFNIISSPNNWAKAVKQSNVKQNLSEGNLFQLSFWKDFSSFLDENSSILKARKPRPQHWYNISIGSSQAHISLVVSIQNNFIRCEIYIPDNKNLYLKLNENKDDIEKVIGYNLDWQELPNAKASRIAFKKEVENLSDPKTQIECFEWFVEISEKYYKAFPKYF